MAMSFPFIDDDDHLLILLWDDPTVERCDPCSHVYNDQDKKPWDKCNHIRGPRKDNVQKGMILECIMINTISPCA